MNAILADLGFRRGKEEFTDLSSSHLYTCRVPLTNQALAPFYSRQAGGIKQKVNNLLQS